MLKETFTTHITFESGDSHKEDPIPGSQLASTITRLCEGPAAVMGIIKSAIIVDQADCICVEIEGRTIVFPQELALKQRTYRNAQIEARKKEQS